jgi:hypothetical protein
LHRHGIVVVLLAYCISGDQHLVTLDLGGGRREIGFRLLQRSHRGVQRGDERRGIDLVEPLPRLDVAAFLEVALQHDAVDARTHLRDEKRVGPPGKLDGDRYRARMYGDDGDFRRRRSGGGLCAVASGNQRDRKGRDEQHQRSERSSTQTWSDL